MELLRLPWMIHPPEAYIGGAVTVGNFDGVHRGHRELILAAERQAEHLGGPTVAVTFDPPPTHLLYPNTVKPPLTTLVQRAELLGEAGADFVVVLQADAGLASLSPIAFFEDVLRGLFQAKAVVEGYNFRFGRNRAGDGEQLRSLCDAAGVTFEEVSPLMIAGEAVSSSRVRAALLACDVVAATLHLGRRYSLQGTVVTGAQRGRTLGFPTANLADVPTVLPGNGVYAVTAMVDDRTYAAAANIGPNPTFGDDSRKIEVHLIDFSGDLYGRNLKIEFVQRMRETKPFSGIATLKAQLQLDIAAAIAACEGAA